MPAEYQRFQQQALAVCVEININPAGKTTAVKQYGFLG